MEALAVVCIRGTLRRDRRSELVVFEPDTFSGLWVKRSNMYRHVGICTQEIATCIRDMMGSYAHLAAPGYVSPKSRMTGTEERD